MRVYPTPIRIFGSFQRNVGTSIEDKPEKCGCKVAVQKEMAETNQDPG